MNTFKSGQHANGSDLIGDTPRMPKTPKFIVYIAMTIDGFIAEEDGGVAFLEEYNPEQFGYTDFFSGVGLLVMGRKTYEQALSFGAWPYESKPCVVLTSSTAQVSSIPSVSFIHPNDTIGLEKLSQSTENSIWIVGGHNTIRWIIQSGIKPRLELYIIPKTLGSGIPLFSTCSWKEKYKLVEAKSYPEGVLKVVYDPE